MPAPGVLLALSLGISRPPPGNARMGSLWRVGSRAVSGAPTATPPAANKSPADRAYGHVPFGRGRSRVPIARAQVRDQEGLGTGLGVLAHQQGSAIAGQVLQPVDVRPVEVDERSEPIADGLCDAAPSPDPPGLIHDRVMFTATAHPATRPSARPAASPRHRVHYNHLTHRNLLACHHFRLMSPRYQTN